MINPSMLKSADELLNNENFDFDADDVAGYSLSVGQPAGSDELNSENFPILEVADTYRPQPSAITDKAIGEIQHRWSITPLYTKNWEYARNTEFMVDEYSGKGGMKLTNGKFIMADDSGRIRYHLREFETDLGYYGIRNCIIKNILFHDDSYTHVATPGVNILDGSIYIDEQTYIKQMCMSIDMDVFIPNEDTPKMQLSHYDPILEVVYVLDGGTRCSFRTKLSELRLIIEKMHSISIEIESITVMIDADGALNDSLILIHSILIAINVA